MKHIKIVTLLLITAFVCSCEPSMKKEVKQKLEEKYGEEFKVYHDAYSYILYEYQFKAAPKKNKKLVFVGDHNKSMTSFKDGYTSEYLSVQFTEQVKAKIEEYTIPAFVHCSGFWNTNSMPDCFRVDTLDLPTIIDTASYISYDITCYLFQELTEKNKKALLTGIYKVIEPYKQHPNANIAVYLSFFKSDFLKGHYASFFKFNRRKNSTPSIPRSEWKNVTQKLDILLHTDKPFIDFNVDTLYKYTQRVTPEKFGVKFTNLNELAKQYAIETK